MVARRPNLVARGLELPYLPTLGSGEKLKGEQLPLADDLINCGYVKKDLHRNLEDWSSEGIRVGDPWRFGESGQLREQGSSEFFSHTLPCQPLLSGCS